MVTCSHFAVPVVEGQVVTDDELSGIHARKSVYVLPEYWAIPRRIPETRPKRIWRIRS